ncbi:TenA family transcriptional regulator [Corallococcus sp. Z5C101001]|uniref:TenA family transcriptional regulator n=1 Tax=Corallococcus sp. Z5C101001 TaxID=2596829 RepID=UPI00117FBC2C|nr:iron-containing redox enzyme family protein [Corallococcus sp. Z5C101001]TSC33672.1 iron-containing redox enzyme family protein [Corallococcus sp. Z5C101001]
MSSLGEGSQVSVSQSGSTSPLKEEDAARRYQLAPLRLTPHPPWMERMLEALRPAWEAACTPELFRDTAEGRHPPLRAWQHFLVRCFPIVERFPKYMGLSLAKTTYGVRPGDASIRRWLLQNLSVEARHAEWWIDWMQAAGVDADKAFQVPLTPEVQALHRHLLEACRNGTLAEGIAAANWAIEGVTGVWTRAVVEPFAAYARDGVRMDSHTLRWLRAHARYDDAHPDEALEILKLTVDESTGEPALVLSAARRSLELLERVFASCGEV